MKKTFILSSLFLLVFGGATSAKHVIPYTDVYDAGYLYTGLLPEPAQLFLLGFSLISLAGFRKKFKD